MKRNFAWILAICAYFICATSPTLAGVQVQHLVGVWLFDEGKDDIAQDASGNGHDGELMETVSWVEEGRFGSALEFHSGEDMVRVEHSDDLTLQTFTIMAWIKTSSAGTGEALIHKQTGSPDRNYILNIRGDDWARASFRSAGADANENCDGTTNVHDDEWHHIAATYDQKNLKVYVDGELDGELSVLGEEPQTNEEPLLFGHAGGTGGWRYTGLMDEVAVYNIALSEDEIRTCMEKGLAQALAVAPVEKLATMWGRIKSK